MSGRVLWSRTIDSITRDGLRSARTDFVDVARKLGPDSTDVEAAQIIFGELIANACEHGQLPVHIELRDDRGELVLAFDDAGTGIDRPARREPDSLRGRGFQIVEGLGGKVTIAQHPVSRVSVRLPLASKQAIPD
jgi:anti-sigma regulatory factor (Ser/Thr protein kinase)